VNRDRCIVIPNAVDLTQFDSTQKAEKDIRAEFGWDRSHKVFCLAGRVVAWKGQDYFIRALAEACKADKRIRGLIVGDGDKSKSNDAYIAGLRSLVTESGLNDIVRFTGNRNDVPDIMKSSDVVVCASSSPEPFGRVIIEGMASGAVVIATDAGGAPDIIENDVNGLLVPIKNSHAMAQAMLRLCTDADLTKRLKVAAMTSVHDLYTANRHVDAVCKIYESTRAPS
jgi:glycosyltransferase involved in cell wall biosynthesis